MTRAAALLVSSLLVATALPGPTAGAPAGTGRSGDGESEPIVGVAASQRDPRGDYGWWLTTDDPDGAPPPAFGSVDIHRMLYVADFDERTFTVRFSVRSVLPASGPRQVFRSSVGNRRFEVRMIARGGGSFVAQGLREHTRWGCRVAGHLDRRHDRVRMTVPLGCFHGATEVRARSRAGVTTAAGNSADSTRRTTTLPLTRTG